METCDKSSKEAEVSVALEREAPLQEPLELGMGISVYQIN